MTKVNPNEIKRAGQLPMAKKDADGNLVPVILQQLVTRPIHRQGNLDIGKLTKAIKAFESTNARRKQLYDIYHDVLLDGHLLSITSKRAESAALADWIFLDKDGKEVDEMSKFIDTPSFSTIVEEIVNARFWGYTMLEIKVNKDGKHSAYLVPRKHMRPETGSITTDEQGMDDFSIRDGRFRHTILEAGKPYDMGLLASASQYAIYKRGDIGDWAEFAEKLGSPILDAMWDGFSEDQRLLLLEAIQSVGRVSALVRPMGTEIKALDDGGTASNPSDVFEKFKTTMNAEMSKIILRQTETTESGANSGYAQAKQHGETEADVNKSDRKYTRQILNERLIPILIAHGFEHLEGGYFAVKNEGEENITLKDRVNIDKTLKSMGLPMSDDYLYEKYGIEKPDNYDEMKAEMEAKAEAEIAAKGMPPGSAEPKPAEKKPAAAPAKPAEKKPATKTKEKKGDGHEKAEDVTLRDIWSARPLFRKLADFFKRQ